jgi:hypothetical protein
MYLLSAVFAAATIVSIADQALLPVAPDAGGVVRAGALGLVLASAALWKPGRSRAVRSA